MTFTPSSKTTSATDARTPEAGSGKTGGFDFTLADAGGTSNTASAIIIVDKPTDQHICFNGVDVTADPSKAVAAIGQKVNLSASLAAVAGQTQPCATSLPVQKQTWEITGNPIASYNLIAETSDTGTPPPCADLVNPKPGCAEVTKLTTADLTQPTIAFYWIKPDKSYAVTYRYTLPDGVSGAVLATFKVVGPSAVNVISQPGTVQVIDNTTGEFPDYKTGTLYLSCGNADTTPCVTFTAKWSGPAGYTGDIQWVQILLSLQVTTNLGPCGLKEIFGLDNAYPYNAGFPNENPEVDSPGVPLKNKYSWMSKVFSARMYLEWIPQLPNSIPVPLGYTQ